jgi:ATP adenylyltransferase/5',5'''-P-1,P-4-tetraphosphate phosphorylase II
VISDKINDLFHSQLRAWELAEKNYSQLDKVLTRSVGFKGFEVIIQFNPQRIKSSIAKVDAKSIGDRPCFLCVVNRPSEQTGIAFGRNLTVLINPYPIFLRHLTITSENHTDQRIINSFGDMLALAKALPDYVIFYNGPQCGASAPDHLHFQAGNRRFMPIENDFSGGSLTELISVFNGTEIWKWKNYLRTLLTLKGNNPVAISNCFATIFDNFSGIQPDKPEPMLNILAYYDTENWIIHIFPRKVHRPSQFFAEGSNKILLSPAAVDLGGVLITPREEDFIKISSTDVADIFRQICLDEDDLTRLLKGLA